MQFFSDDILLKFEDTVTVDSLLLLKDKISMVEFVHNQKITSDDDVVETLCRKITNIFVPCK